MSDSDDNSKMYHEIYASTLYKLVEEAFKAEYVGAHSVTDLLPLKDGKFLVVFSPDLRKQMERDQAEAGNHDQ